MSNNPPQPAPIDVQDFVDRLQRELGAALGRAIAAESTRDALQARLEDKDGEQ